MHQLLLPVRLGPSLLTMMPGNSPNLKLKSSKTRKKAFFSFLIFQMKHGNVARVYLKAISSGGQDPLRVWQDKLHRADWTSAKTHKHAHTHTHTPTLMFPESPLKSLLVIYVLISLCTMLLHAEFWYHSVTLFLQSARAMMCFFRPTPKSLWPWLPWADFQTPMDVLFLFFFPQGFENFWK